MPVVLETFVPPTDITPPVITLLGNAQLAVTPSGTIVMIHTLNIFTKWKDPGVVAVDDFDGNVTSKVLAWPAASTQGKARPVSTAAVTPPDDPYVITYFVADKAGNDAVVVRRRVVVVNPCTGTEFPCPEGQCSVDSRCPLGGALTLEEEEEVVVVNSPPTISLYGEEQVRDQPTNTKP